MKPPAPRISSRMGAFPPSATVLPQVDPELTSPTQARHMRRGTFRFSQPNGTHRGAERHARGLRMTHGRPGLLQVQAELVRIRRAGSLWASDPVDSARIAATVGAHTRPPPLRPRGSAAT